MRPSEALETLKKLQRWFLKYSDYYKAITVAISALEKQEANRWIPVTERPPEESDLYLVTVDKDYFPENCSQVDFLYWDSEAKEWKFVYEEYKLEKFDAPVIAWKTRPEPYKERVMDGQELGHRNSG